jgi:hypothetical protein
MTIILDGSTGISSIGTLTGVTSISSAAANTPVVMQDSGSNTNTCRAWVNFNGTGTVAIRGSFNVSSITDNGTGDYTVNFTTAMPNANYCFSLSANDDGTGTGGPAQTNGFSYGAWKRGPNSCVYNTSSIRFQIGYPASSDLYDQTHINVAIFR